jgi:adenylate cyclase
MELSRSRLLAAVTLTALVVAFVALAGRSTVYEDLNLWTYDFLVNHGGYSAPSQDVALVDFDDSTFQWLAEYPVPRRKVAEVLQRVSAAHPAVIGLDIFLSESRPEGDAEMQAALTQAGNVILASQSDVGGIPSTLPLPQFCQPEVPNSISGFCKDGTPGGLGFAPVNLPVDSDGFVRRFLLLLGAKPPAISFSLMLAQQLTGESIHAAGNSAALFHNHRIPYVNRDDKSVLIGAWNRKLLHTISARSILDGSAQLSGLNNKIVIIGQSSDAARDRHFTPLFRGAAENGERVRLSGPEIHAAAVATLLSGNAIAPARPAILWLVNTAIVFVLLCVFLAAPVRYAVGGLFLGAAAIYAFAQLLFSEGHLWFPFLSSIVGLAFTAPAGLGYRFFEERLLRSRVTAEREQIMGMFSRYVSPDVAQQIWDRREELILAGEERVATVIFTDIRSFTAITAGKPSQIVLRWLNDYLTAMDEVITAHRGFLNKFIGDGLMILFGVPLSGGEAEDAQNAVNCALAMIERVARSNEGHSGDADYPQLKIGVGIHTGKLTSGNIGSVKRMEYSVIGETVNLASRLESLTKEFHCDIIMSATTYERVEKSGYDLRPLGPVAVRGFDEKIELYGLNAAPTTGIVGEAMAGRSA